MLMVSTALNYNKGGNSNKGSSAVKKPKPLGNTVTKLDHYNLKWPVRANFLNKRIWTKYSSHWKLISMQYIEIKIKVMESMSEFIDTWMYRNKTFFSLISMLPLSDLWELFYEAWEDRHILECCPCPVLEEIYSTCCWTGRLVHGLCFHIYIGKITEGSWRRTDSILSFLLKNRKSMFWFSG